MARILFGIALVLAALGAAAETPLKIKPLAEKKVTQLPPDPLYWAIENFPSLDAAKAAGGDYSLAVESGGKAWLFTLGARGGRTSGGTKVSEVGPIPRVSASQYLLRINEATGPNGAVTSIHSHPGSEAFYVVAGEQTIRSPHGVMKVQPGQPAAGQGADVAMQVSSTGSTDLRALVMFVVDAGRPFSSPAKLH
jgi:quercetin dioxygenase-like cupin family protein